MKKEPSEMRFLVVDDEFHIRKIVKAVCQSIGVRDVVEASTGRIAWEYLRQKDLHDSAGKRKKFDLIICDWMMPEMTGIGLLRSVREDRALKGTPFLMLTAEAEREMVTEAISLKVNDYIVKPFTADVLEQKIRKVLS